MLHAETSRKCRKYKMIQIPRPVLIVLILLLNPTQFRISSEWLRDEIKAAPKTLSIEEESNSNAYNSRESDSEADSDK